MKSPGAGFNQYGVPSKHESKVTRTLIRSQPATTGSGAARTPLEALDGTLTPSGLHFERSHSGVPDIDPDKHRLLIHGMVKRPLIMPWIDRKSTRLNSSHLGISYAVFCLKKKKK